MRADGDILLVSLYELGHQPLQLAWPLGFLRAAGFAPAALDLFAEKLDEERVRAARAIFVSVPMHTALRLGVRFLARAQALNPAARIGFYGLYATLNGDYLLHRGADAILGGEYESALLALCEALSLPEWAKGTRREMPMVKGVTTRGRREPPVMTRLPFVVPERKGLIPLPRYARFDPGDGGPQQTAGYVEASRGCKHLCRHCPIPPVYRGRFFVVPREIVLADVAQQVRQGAEHITFGDPDFLNGPGHAIKVARALHREFPKITFDVTAKVEHILKHRGMWPELAALGCRFVVSAVESLSPRVLALLHKGHGPADVEAALRVLREAGIAMRPSLVAFTPMTTLLDYLEVLAFVERHGLQESIDPVQFTIRLLVPPGSSLLEAPELAPYLGTLDEERLTYIWRHPDPRMDALHAAVTFRVQEAVTQKEAPGDTLAALQELALRAAFGREIGRDDVVRARATQSKAPRLTEPWFC